jgi:hypothetical protein
VTEPAATTIEDARYREELLREHAEQRHVRDRSALGSAEWQAAATRIGEIEVEIAKLDRATSQILRPNAGAA